MPNDEEAQEDPRELRRRLMKERREKHQKRFSEPPEPEEYKFQAIGVKPAVCDPAENNGGKCCAAPPAKQSRALEFEQEPASVHEDDLEDAGKLGDAEPVEDDAAEPLEADDGVLDEPRSGGEPADDDALVNEESIPDDGIAADNEDGLGPIPEENEGEEGEGSVNPEAPADGEDAPPPADGEQPSVQTVPDSVDKIEGEPVAVDGDAPPQAEVTAAA
eukprot:GHVU01012364.1.p2 GENE.GHVU01012364.1~~GHVU01012364.1.p2  ORF type:complete len:239 (+),score=54.78 GHVU01012364.1:65-718(+)